MTGARLRDAWLGVWLLGVAACGGPDDATSDDTEGPGGAPGSGGMPAAASDLGCFEARGGQHQRSFRGTISTTRSGRAADWGNAAWWGWGRETQYT